MQDLFLYNMNDEGDAQSMDMDGEDGLGAEVDLPAEIDEEEDFSDFAGSNDEE